MAHKKQLKGENAHRHLQIHLDAEKRRLERKIKVFGDQSKEVLVQKERVKRVQEELENL